MLNIMKRKGVLYVRTRTGLRIIVLIHNNLCSKAKCNYLIILMGNYEKTLS